MGKIGQKLVLRVVARVERTWPHGYRYVDLRPEHDEEAGQPPAPFGVCPERVGLGGSGHADFRMTFGPGEKLPPIGAILTFVGGIGGDECVLKAEADEPLFTLLARDPQGPLTVRYWVWLRLVDAGLIEDDENVCDAEEMREAIKVDAQGDDLLPAAKRAKLLEALAHADAMESWLREEREQLAASEG